MISFQGNTATATRAGATAAVGPRKLPLEVPALVCTDFGQDHIAKKVAHMTTTRTFEAVSAATVC